MKSTSAYLLEMVRDVKNIANKAREFEPIAGKMFGGNESTGQHRALADAIDRLCDIMEILIMESP